MRGSRREREGEDSAEIVAAFCKLKTLKRALKSKGRSSERVAEGERRWRERER